MTEPCRTPLDNLGKEIAHDLGRKAGNDAVAAIQRTLAICPSPVVRLATAVFAANHVMAIPLAIMMGRKDKTAEQVVDALFDMLRPQLIGAVTDVRADHTARAPETAPPPPVERGAPPVHPYTPGPDPVRKPSAAPERKADA